MTKKDSEMVVGATYSALISELGQLGDLPYEFANTVANIYFRYFQSAVDSAPAISTQEIIIRKIEYETISKVVMKFRLMHEQNAPKHLVEYVTQYHLDVFKYRIPNAEKKRPIFKRLERLFRKPNEIPNLVRSLQLYQ